MHKVIVLGASGFVGKNVSVFLKDLFRIIETTRNPADEELNEKLYFDINDESSWSSITDANPTCIINCIGYGVVREEADIQQTYAVNYFQTIRFFQFLSDRNFEGLLIHIGTAFEYDLNTISITEHSFTIPVTHYGISKLMTSEFLLQKRSLKNFIILRPFSMFGPYENNNKIIPALILSQKNKAVLKLSSGSQKRDYLFINDLAIFIGDMIASIKLPLARVLNVGSGVSRSILELSHIIYDLLPSKNSIYWNWGSLEQRSNEGSDFRNGSSAAIDLGLKVTDLSHGLNETIKYYWKNDI